MEQDLREIEQSVRYVCGFWAERNQTPAPSFVKTLIRDFNISAQRARPLSKGETGIVSLLRPKTAALLADRVWLQYAGADDGLDFGFGWESPMSVRLATLHTLMTAEEDSGEATESDSEGLCGAVEEVVRTTEGRLARDYCERCSARISPLYTAAAQRDPDYVPGDYSVVVSVIENVALVSEDTMSWDQVLEFREDADARKAYRRFVHWLDRDMMGRSASFICDEVSERLELYHWALRKHGLMTVIGSLERTVGARSLFGAGVVGVAAQSLAHEPLIAVLSGAGLLVGQMAFRVCTALIERQDVLVENKEIAFVHELQRKRG